MQWAIYESWNNIALTKGGQNSPIYKGWKPCKPSMVFTPDCSQLSFTTDKQKAEKISKTILIFCFFQVRPLGWSFISSRFGLKCIKPSPHLALMLALTLTLKPPTTPTLTLTLPYVESFTLTVLIMPQIHEKTVTHYKKDAHKLTGDREWDATIANTNL